MTPEEKRQLELLVKQIEVEKDHEVFTALVRELDELLARKDKRLDPKTNGINSER